MLDFQKLGWPPEDDVPRLGAYRRYERVFSGDHATAFEQTSARMPDGMRRIIYVSVNLGGLLSKVSSDFLFGEAPVFRVGDPDTKEQMALEDLVRNNDLLTTFYEAGLSASFRGDAVFRTREGRRNPRDDAAREVIVEEVPAYSYFVERDPDNVREVLSESIAWSRKDPVRGRHHLRVETHLPGTIVQTAFELNPDTEKVGLQVRLSDLYGDAAPPEETETGVEDPLLVHVPNYRHGSLYFGLSDYEDVMTLFDALNNRLSKIDRILDHHADPKLVGVPGLADPRGAVDVSKLAYIEADSEIFKYLPRYITWDGQLEAAYRELERIVLYVCQVTETSPAALGLNDGSGGSAESGVALRLRYLTTEHKTNRKKRYFDRGLKRLLKVALELGAATLGTPAPDREPEIQWQDGIPQIYAEAVTTEVARTAAGLTSKVSAIQRIDQCTAEQAEEELQRIRDEAEAEPKDATLEDWMNGGRLNHPEAPSADGSGQGPAQDTPPPAGPTPGEPAP